VTHPYDYIGCWRLDYMATEDMNMGWDSLSEQGLSYEEIQEILSCFHIQFLEDDCAEFIMEFEDSMDVTYGTWHFSSDGNCIFTERESGDTFECFRQEGSLCMVNESGEMQFSRVSAAPEKCEMEPLELESVFPDDLPTLFCLYSDPDSWEAATSLSLYTDGSFMGYCAREETRIGQPIPSGTQYTCTFIGEFADIQKINDYTWSMTLHEIDTEDEAGTAWEQNGTYYLATEPIGMVKGDTYYLYSPDAPADALPAAVREEKARYYAEYAYVLCNESLSYIFPGMDAS